MWHVEVTDTFGGEANYSWVRRWELPNAPHDDHRLVSRWLVREAKKLAGWTGVRCTTEDEGDLITIRPQGACMVMFIMWRDLPDEDNHQPPEG